MAGHPDGLLGLLLANYWEVPDPLELLLVTVPELEFGVVTPELFVLVALLPAVPPAVVPLLVPV
jgi:hypothetical protein